MFRGRIVVLTYYILLIQFYFTSPKGFDSLKGCRFHENIHCTKRRKKNKSFDSAHALFDELKDSSDEEYSDEEYLSDDYYYKQTNYTCFRCGRKGHIANNCFASKHIKGYYL